MLESSQTQLLATIGQFLLALANNGLARTECNTLSTFIDRMSRNAADKSCFMLTLFDFVSTVTWGDEGFLTTHIFDNFWVEGFDEWCVVLTIERITCNEYEFSYRKEWFNKIFKEL